VSARGYFDGMPTPLEVRRRSEMRRCAVADAVLVPVAVVLWLAVGLAVLAAF